MVSKLNEENIVSNEVKEEIKEMFSKETQEQDAVKKVIADKNNNQFSLKIPKNLATKSLLTEKSKFRIVFNPSQKTLKQLRKSRLIIYIQE